MDAKLRSVLIEARARVMWGTPPDEIREWLRSQGLGPAEVDAVVSQCLRERAAEVRKAGLRDLVVGSGLFLAGAAGIAIIFALDTRVDRLLGLSGIGVAVGLWRIVTGIDRLLSGSKAPGSLTDM